MDASLMDDTLREGPQGAHATQPDTSGGRFPHLADRIEDLAAAAR